MSAHLQLVGGTTNHMQHMYNHVLYNIAPKFDTGNSWYQKNTCPKKAAQQLEARSSREMLRLPARASSLL